MDVGGLGGNVLGQGMLGGCVCGFVWEYMFELRGVRVDLSMDEGELLIERVCPMYCVDFEYEVVYIGRMRYLLKNHQVV